MSEPSPDREERNRLLVWAWRRLRSPGAERARAGRIVFDEVRRQVERYLWKKHAEEVRADLASDVFLKIFSVAPFDWVGEDFPGHAPRIRAYIRVCVVNKHRSDWRKQQRAQQSERAATPPPSPPPDIRSSLQGLESQLRRLCDRACAERIAAVQEGIRRSTKEMLDRRAAISLEQGSEGLEAITPLNNALHDLKGELDPSFPLSESETLGLFTDIQAHLTGIYQAEKEALAALRTVVGEFAINDQNTPALGTVV